MHYLCSEKKAISCMQGYHAVDLGFVCAYAKTMFSHDMAHMFIPIYLDFDTLG